VAAPQRWRLAFLAVHESASLVVFSGQAHVDPARAWLSVVHPALPASKTATVAGMTVYVYPYDVASRFH
jgi:hypothetical protein